MALGLGFRDGIYLKWRGSSPSPPGVYSRCRFRVLRFGVEGMQIQHVTPKPINSINPMNPVNSKMYP